MNHKVLDTRIEVTWKKMVQQFLMTVKGLVKKLILIIWLIPVSLIVGCAGIMQEAMEDTTYHRFAVAIAELQVCTEYGAIDKILHGKSLQNIHRNMDRYSYDEERFVDLYLQKYEKFDKSSIKDFKCKWVLLSAKDDVEIQRLKNENAARQQQLNNENAAIQQQNMASAIQQLNEGSAQFRSGAEAMNQRTPVYIPTITPTMQQNTSRHYMINTSTGMKRCTVTESGVTFCN